MSVYKPVAVAFFALIAVVGSASDVFAQPVFPSSRPTFSPYLNLARSGSSPTLNYYGLVRPEINNRQNIQAIQSVAASNQRSIGDLVNGGEFPTTGVSSQFMNHYSYFQNQGSGNFGRGQAGRSNFTGGSMGNGGGSMGNNGGGNFGTVGPSRGANLGGAGGGNFGGGGAGPRR
jgi:hypothetical protein